MAADAPIAAPTGVTASFRFYEELNDFLAPERRRTSFECRCAQAATTKHMVEALGVPHTEVELLLVNGESVGFDRQLQQGDRVAVYPKFEALDITPLLRVRERPLRTLRFVADAHLGGLAHGLRMTGFDTLYDNHYHDDEVERLARDEQRIVLTRDRELLKRRNITHGCYVRPLKPRQQLQHVFERLDLARSAQPFTRCLRCNGLLRPARAGEIAAAPDDVRQRHQRFAACDGCGGLFWEGSHWRRMRAELDALLGPDR
ncbi:Mut7-C ubiquitin/RNAse domain-containing protein [Aquincola sp. S2]|uniref:Mut7-C ubiquitin/RNAse domain-containing protein n=1 Tax=Pseudaquabacterium terrae TaxID=2732868 RepID=A0ABX2EFN5_9BURK|nr:Mut7-C RNAse domain-containing protein [Aquabacterium terrae]NRF67408.1 Mut7-C ubiquitin/RNAse domain-containing protein [Aquabacterium terrae]